VPNKLSVTIGNAKIRSEQRNPDISHGEEYLKEKKERKKEKKKEKKKELRNSSITHLKVLDNQE